MSNTLPSFLEFEDILSLIGLPVSEYKRHSRRRFSIRVSRQDPEPLFHWSKASLPESMRLREWERGEMKTYFGQFPRIDLYYCYPAQNWILVGVEVDNSIVPPRVDPMLRNRWIPAP